MWASPISRQCVRHSLKQILDAGRNHPQGFRGLAVFVTVDCVPAQINGVPAVWQYPRDNPHPDV